VIAAERWADVVQLLRAAARAEIMPRFRKLRPEMVRAKAGPNDLVTEADEAAEVMITAGLRHLFPCCLVVGEEATAADPALLDRLADAKLAFVVDPIDGTSNFVAGLPLFGVMVAAVIGGEVVAGAIHDPVGDDTAVALRGQGAWSWLPDGTSIRMHVSKPLPPERMTGAVSWRFMPDPLRGAVVRNMVQLGGVSDYRCAAHEYRMLAAGHCDFLVFNKLMPWDHLPGWLLHQEAGGFSAHFDGSAYRPGDKSGGLVCTPDRASFEALRDLLLAPS
jgi:fructose-1,6-bisphosphatase/inositol monophosphatase family enzyme